VEQKIKRKLYIQPKNNMQRREYNKRYVDKVLKLTCLSPKIIESILNGTQPKDITTNIKTTDWKEQEKHLLSI
jgi:hypothetical protein